MKTLLSSVLAMTVLLSAQGAQAAPRSWKIDTDHKIYYLADPVLRLSLTNVKADDEDWDWLQVSLNYEGDSMGAQAAALEQANPGYQAERLVQKGNSNYTLRIPSLGIEQVIETLPGQEGGYFHTDIMVAKKDSSRVHQAFADLNNFAQVQGTVSSPQPVSVLKERATLPNSICGRLGQGQTELYSLILAYPGVESEIRNVAKDAKNQAALRTQVLSGCFELANGTDAQIRSAHDLLGTKLEIQKSAASFVSEVYDLQWQAISLPLQYSVALEKAGQ